MDVQSYFGKKGGGPTLHLTTSRRSALLIALLCGMLAAALVYVFVSHRKTQTVAAPPATATIFVAKHYIAAGTPETVIAADNLLKPKSLPVGQVVPGAITDPSEIAKQVSSAPIAAGQQVTSTDFSQSNVTIGSYLKHNQRAVAVAMDPAHGLESYLTRGEKVDVLSQGKTGSSVLFEKVTVLSNHGGAVVLDLSDEQALALANALQQGFQIWFALRPATGSTDPVSAGYKESF